MVFLSPPPLHDREIFRSPSASARVERGVEFLLSVGASREIAVVAASTDAASRVAQRAATQAGSVFGWHRFTLARLAGALAAKRLAARGVTPVGPLPLTAIVARLVHRLGAAELGRFAGVADRPGLPRALARTLDELRMAGIGASEVPDVDLARLLVAYEEELARAALVDRAEVLRIAAEVATEERRDGAGRPVLFLDVPVQTARELELAGALCAGGGRLLFTVPAGDEPTLLRVAALPDLRTVESAGHDSTALERVRAGLFSPNAALAQPGEDVVILSAPGESRECVEIARLLHAEAERGTPFDRMAVLLRSPQQYRAHLAEALRRAGIPSHFARGIVRPDPAGRAFLALLACAAEGLSARRFAEYLSLGEVAAAVPEGAPPPPAPATERFVPPDEEIVSGALRSFELSPPADDDADPLPSSAAPIDPAGAAPAGESTPRAAASTVDGTLRAPRLWERLLVDAAVIGGRERWQKRLRGLCEKLKRDRSELELTEEARALHLERDIEALDRLSAYALPILDDIERLATPFATDWRGWLDALTALATRALRRPERVLAVLSELAPMSDVGPVDLTEVRLVLERRLTELVVRPSERPFGRVYVGAVEEARGLSFDVVFVPGLAERLFPQKVTEDPILPDRMRAKLAGRLRTNHDRSAAERLMLRIAVGAAERRLILSYPRVDVEQSRPRTPSFYGLEVLRAAEGRLPGFDELADRAERVVEARLGWPAPSSPAQAIDAAEHDLALLQSILGRPAKETVGTARYLLSANAHLARALRFRARRWNVAAFTRADGLVDPDPLARAALAAHSLEARSFSATALQHYAACPYRFALSALHKLAPRQAPEALEELDPLQRGSLIHEVQFELLGKLRDAGLLPVTPEGLVPARALLDAELDAVAAHYKEKLAPAIDKVWEDGIASIRGDLREMLRRASEGSGWVPSHFELAFGLPERSARESDQRSVKEPAALSNGIKLRGSIDLVERHPRGGLRATDYKTGKARAVDGMLIGGGQILQPVLYALALEALFPGERIDSGRLYYCSSNGEFKEVTIPLDDEARAAAGEVAKTIGDALRQGFLPAAPAPRACEYCDYRPVCGPYEELRTSRMKRQDKLAPLLALRKRV